MLTALLVSLLRRETEALCGSLSAASVVRGAGSEAAACGDRPRGDGLGAGNDPFCSSGSREGRGDALSQSGG